MRRRQFLSLAASAGAASALGPRAVHAQFVTGTPRIAILSIPVPSSTFDFIAEGLADYGYVEGRNIVTQRFTAPTTPEVPAYAARAVASPIRKPTVMTRSGSSEAIMPSSVFA